MEIPFTKHTLENGLDVIVHEDHRLPIVAVNVWYHVGSKNERPGRTGFAHLFEHLMFEGSAHHDRGYFQPLQDAGAALNGSTNADRTNYWEVVPTTALGLALWMESDRMGYLLPALTEKKFDNQRSVVLNERRQNYENRPYGLSSVAIVGALYPEHHPYHWPTIGEARDLQAATLDDAIAFFQRYYHPANASIALAGDVETQAAIDEVRRHFEGIPAGPAVVSPTLGPPSPLDGEVRLVLEDRVELPRLYLTWHSPALFADGDAACDLLADLLGHGKTSRLYRALVHDRRLAVDVSAGQSSREVSGLFQIVVTAAGDVPLSAIHPIVEAELASVAERGAREEELKRGLAQAEAEFVYRLQTVGGFGGKSDQLNAYNVLLDDPGYFARDLDRYRRLTVEDVRRVADGFRGAGRVALSVVPAGRLDLALPDSRPAEAA